MIRANNKEYNWNQGMSIYNLLELMGYKLKSPSVLVTVNNNIIRKNNWDSFTIPENAEVSVLNLLRGG